MTTGVGFKDLSGQIFGKLTVLGRAPVSGRRASWECQCQCGSVKVIAGYSLRGGLTKSCGCLRHESPGRPGCPVRREYLAEYGVWNSMMNRCGSIFNRNYHRYGGRGITVCERWLEFENFALDMGHRPSHRHTLDRVNNERGYSPENCQWRTYQDQARNTRRNRMVTFRGETLCVAAWADRTGIPGQVIRKRIVEHLWSIEDALTVPLGSRRKSG